jgi:NAD(P)-dependent dehydrogenase (short-subunit alcohol dehydrogenase family)
VNDKQILITGATNGIGLAAAEALAALGANLAIVGRSKTRTRIASARIRAAPPPSSTLPMSSDRKADRRSRTHLVPLGYRVRRRGTVSDNWGRVVRTFPEQKRHTQDTTEALRPTRH